MATPNYDINYNDKRLTSIQKEGETAVKDSNKTYDDMISQSDKFYDKQIKASKDYAKTQTDLQNQKTDFAIEKIEQQKEQTRQDYLKEQSGAYVDWQKQSGQYGVNAEKQAAAGLGGTGFSESSQVSMYNTYQNRVATARESYIRAVLNYDNAIKDAQIQNNALLAEIAYNSLKEQLQLSLAGFQYKNQLLLDKAKTKREIDDTYYGRYRDEINQINTENSMAESVRQYNEKMAEEKRQYNADLAEKKRQFNASLAEDKRQYNEKMAWQKSQAKSSGSSSSGGSKSSGGKVNKSSNSNKSKKSSDSNKTVTKTTTNNGDAVSALNRLIAAGASKDKVSNAIAIALRNGEISKAEAQKLRNTFTPRGVAY